MLRICQKQNDRDWQTFLI